MVYFFLICTQHIDFPIVDNFDCLDICLHELSVDHIFINVYK